VFLDEASLVMPCGTLYLHHPNKEHTEEEPMMAVASGTQSLLPSVDDLADSPSNLKALIDSMNDHIAWVAPVSIDFECSMCDTNHFVDLTGGDEAGPNGTGDRESISVDAIKEEEIEETGEVD
jgi:hypothetical protein